VSRSEWLRARRSAVGASEVAAVLGLGAYGSPVTVWASKVGEIDDSPPGGPAAMGLDLEPFILAEAGRRLGGEVVDSQVAVSSDRCPFLRSTLDGLISSGGEMVPVEAKFVTHDAMTWGDDPTLDWDALGRWLEDSSAPFPAGTRAESAYVQVQAQMICAGASHAYLVGVMGARAGYLLRLGHDVPSRCFRLLRIPADESLQATICEAVPGFWRAHVETKTPPPEVTARDLDAIKRHLRQSAQAEAVDRVPLAPLAKGLDRERRRVKHHQRRAKAFEARLRAELLDAPMVYAGPWTVTAKTNARGARPITIRRRKD
jgi:predicted phage-related endonuclease